MKRLLILLALAAVAVGCSGGNVDAEDVKEWQNEGRAPDDPAQQATPSAEAEDR